MRVDAIPNAVGTFKQDYAASASFTFTSFNSLAGSSTFVAGAGSLAVSNLLNKYEDVLIGGIITWSSTAPVAGTLRLDVHVYAALSDAPTYPQDGSGNALGTDTARTFAAASDKQNGIRLGGTIVLTGTASKVYSVVPFSLRQLFGNMPTHFGLWVTHGSTTANSTPHSSGNTFYYTPCFGSYT